MTEPISKTDNPRMEYKILEDWILHELEKEVGKHIGNGWQPLGGVAVRTQLSGTPSYYQAMTRTAHD